MNFAPVVALMEETTPVAPTAMDKISEGVTTLLTVAGTVITYVVSQPVLCAFVSVSFVGIGIAIFRKLRH